MLLELKSEYQPQHISTQKDWLMIKSSSCLPKFGCLKTWDGSWHTLYTFQSGCQEELPQLQNLNAKASSQWCSLLTRILIFSVLTRQKLLDQPVNNSNELWSWQLSRTKNSSSYWSTQSMLAPLRRASEPPIQMGKTLKTTKQTAHSVIYSSRRHYINLK